MLGRGVYSKVWLTYRIEKEDFVALKMIHEEDDATALREIDINKKFDKSSKLKIMLDSFEFMKDKDKYFCLVFPLYGGTVYDLLKDNTFTEKHLDNIFNQIKVLLKELHTKHRMIHGDIKPENFSYAGKNPICEDLINRFHKLGGIKAFKTDDISLDEACKKLVKELLNDDDYNSSNFDVYNSSNEDSNENDSADEESENSSFTTVSDSSSTSTSVYDSLSDLSDDLEVYKLSEEELDNLTVFLIDYSHIHSLDEDLIFEPTRYYRCIATLEKKPAGFYKDTYALACSMYELQTGDVFVDPQSDNKDKEQVELIKENFHKIEKWLNK
jgi:serine/threonine protein kinase